MARKKTEPDVNGLMPRKKKNVEINEMVLSGQFRSKPVIGSANKKNFNFDDWDFPETMGNAPKVVCDAHSVALSQTRSLLEHALDGAYAMGIPTFLGYPTLVGLSQHPMIRAGVEARTNSMTAKWGNVVSSSKRNEVASTKVTQLTQAMNKFKVRDMFNFASDMCGYLGVMYYFIDTGDKQDDLANPLILTKETFEAGSLKGFRPVEPYLVTPGIYNAINPLASDYFKPSVFYVQGIPVHRSRLIIFKENELPAMLRPAYNFGGISLAQKALDAVCHYTESREAMVRMLMKSSTMVFKSDMSDIFNGETAEMMNRRIQYFVQNRDNDGVAVIDRDREDLGVVQSSLAGFSDVVHRCQEDVCSSFHKSAVKMFGISPQGFSTGETDERNDIEYVMISQQKIFGAPMEKVMKVLQMNTYGVIDDDIKFVFAPLNEQDEQMKLQNEMTKAQIDNILAQMQVISPEDIRERILKDEDSGYETLKPMQKQNQNGGNPMEQMMGQGGGEMPPEAMMQQEGNPMEQMQEGEEVQQEIPQEMMQQEN